MTLKELFSVQADSNKLKSLYIELANHENFNPYKNNIISDLPKGSEKGKDFSQWYLKERKGSRERLSTIKIKCSAIEKRLMPI